MKGFLLDLNRCTGCHACRLACSIENRLGEGKYWRQIYTFNPQRIQEMSRFHLSLACHHCADPACLSACPAGVFTKDVVTGAVLVDARRCIGCKYCSWACPFDAPRYDIATGTISKCTLCTERLHAGLNPACTTLCPTGALQFTDLDPQPGIAVVPGFAETGMTPSTRFVPLRAHSGVPELSAAAASHSLVDVPVSAAAPPARVSMKSEWPLVMFTLISALLVAIATGAAVGKLRLQAWEFAAAAFAAVTLSAIHLGRPARAWRALLHVRRSWLSREIGSFLAFAGLSTAMLAFPGVRTFGVVAVLAGFFTLFCIDRVYCAVSAGIRTCLHSAGSLLTGLFLYGLLVHDARIAGAAGLAKLASYSFRKDWVGGDLGPAAVLRLALGFVVPLANWDPGGNLTLVAVMAAELIDRFEYYLELDIRTPQKQMEEDLRQQLALHPQGGVTRS